MAKYRSGKYSKAIDPSELWSLDVVMSEFILPRIKMLRALTGMESCLLGDGAKLNTDHPTPEETDLAWEQAEADSAAIYDQIIYGLELNIKNATDPLIADERKDMEKGLCLLGKYYSSMWS